MTAATGGRSWQVEVPLVKGIPPLSMNSRAHWARTARKAAELRVAMAWKYRAARIPRMNKVRLALYYAPPDKRKRDADNLVATLKVVKDALQDAGIVPDDTPRYVEALMPILVEPRRPAQCWVAIEEVP